MARPELVSLNKERTTRLTSFPERPNSGLVLCTDVEGPLYLGDFIADAMENMLKPQNGRIKTYPSYGQIIYQQSWELFTAETIGNRRSLTLNDQRRTSHSLSQEGTDTIFTLPLLIAEGASYSYLENLALNSSKQTPGSGELIKRLDKEGIFMAGITTAPQEPYRTIVKKDGVLDPSRIIGSPFPIDETKRLLEETGCLDTELSMVRDYLNECYFIIDRNSSFSEKDGNIVRDLSNAGKLELLRRIKRFHDQQLGISYDFQTRKERPSQTILGQVIEAVGMVGDRAKAAVALDVFRKMNSNNKSLLVTMGDGANDAVMLYKAPISIGINGADAAKAAKIGIVTENMLNLLPIFEQLAGGERDIPTIVARARDMVDPTTIIHEGGTKTSEALLTAHKNMKRKLRGQNITY